MLGLGGAALSFGPTRRAIMARGWLPEPGKGPSRAKMLRGRYAMTFVASSPTSGAGATATTWTGAGDASCIHTTIFLCEASRVFAFGQKPRNLDDTYVLSMTHNIIIYEGYASI